MAYETSREEKVMDDDRVIEFERNLWIGDGEIYERSISSDCLMIVPQQPFMLQGREAVEAVEGTPRWSHVDFSDFTIKRPREGIIVVAYHADANRGGEHYAAYCTSTYQRLGHDDWVVVQHQQTTPPHMLAESSSTGMESAQKQAAEERETARGYQ